MPSVRAPRLSRLTRALGVVVVGSLAGCGERATAASSPPTAGVVDSALPREELLRRFTADLATRPAALGGEFTTRESLVRALASALERSDAVALERLALDRAEFAYLYYPTSPEALPPYELGPGLLWARLQATNRRGALRLLDLRSGVPLHYVGHECARHERQGENVIWSGCAIRRRADSGGAVHERLFAAILERGGRFKILSYANGL